MATKATSRLHSESEDSTLTISYEEGSALSCVSVPAAIEPQVLLDQLAASNDQSTATRR